MTKYEESKWICEKEMIEVAYRIKNMEEEMDKVYKASMYIIGKYKKELIEEFKIKVTPKEDFFKCSIFEDTPKKFNETIYESYVEREIFDVIGEEMKKKYPNPWYTDGISSTKEKESE